MDLKELNSSQALERLNENEMEIKPQVNEETRKLAFDIVQTAINKAKEHLSKMDKEKQHREYLRTFAKSTVDNVYALVRKRLKIEEAQDCTKKASTAELQIPSFLDKNKILPYKEFIRPGGIKTNEGSDIVLLDTSRLPNKKNFKELFNKSHSSMMFDETMQSLCSYAEHFINTQVKSDDYILFIHASNGACAKAPALKWAKEFYKILTTCNSSGALNNCFISKPSLKLKASVLLKRPFMRSSMRKKIHLVRDLTTALEGQGLPGSVVTM